MIMSPSRVLCDDPMCKSFVDLSAPEDLKSSIRSALEKRGWTVVSRDEEPDQQFCPSHKPCDKKD